MNNEHKILLTDIKWHWKRFEDLSVHELHELLALRQSVFIIEQNCVYADIDDLDKTSWHCMGMLDNSLLAYSRVISRFRKHQISIGRLLTRHDIRGQSVGKELLQQSIYFIETTFSGMPIKISAQEYLYSFYSSFGFVKDSEPYSEDGIMHIDMLKR